MNCESWCAVEWTASQDWMRAERKHYKNAFTSTVFKQNRKGIQDLKIHSNNVVRKEKRHFVEKYKTEFNM